MPDSRDELYHLVTEVMRRNPEFVPTLNVKQAQRNTALLMAVARAAYDRGYREGAEAEGHKLTEYYEGIISAARA